MSQKQPHAAFLAEPPYLGVPIFFAGHDWLVPSLSVRQFQAHLPVLQNPPQGEGREEVEARFQALIPVIGAAIRRNYPEITDEMLFDELDMSTFIKALRAVQNASGMEPVRPGETPTQTAP